MCMVGHVEVCNNRMVVFILCQIQLVDVGECVDVRLVFGVAIKCYVGDVEAAGKEISEEEGDNSLIPSSTLPLV